MKNALIVALVNWMVLPLAIFAGEEIFRIDNPGYLVDSNRNALAVFSTFALFVGEADGSHQLPCRAIYRQRFDTNECRRIEFSSVLTENGKKHESIPLESWTVADDSSPMPKHLQIGILNFEFDEDHFNPVLTVKGADFDECGRSDSILYRGMPDKFFRYLRSCESDACFWYIRLFGKRVDHRIYSADSAGDDFCVEVADIKSQYFTRMILKYNKDDGDFRLSKILLMGNHVYQGGMSQTDPASLEMRRIFVHSESILVDGDGDDYRIVETGRGFLKSRNVLRYKIFAQNASEPFKVELEVCDD